MKYRIRTCREIIADLRSSWNWIKKPRNLAKILAVIFALLLSIPLFAGIVSIVLQDNTSQPATSTGVEVVQDSSSEENVSPDASLSLALLSAALGGLTLWFAGRTKSFDDSDTSEDSEDQKGETAQIVHYVRSYLFAAIAFSLFALLCPILPDIRGSTEWYDVFARYVAAISLIAGSITFAMTISLMVIDIWIWKLR